LPGVRLSSSACVTTTNRSANQNLIKTEATAPNELYSQMLE